MKKQIASRLSLALLVAAAVTSTQAEAIDPGACCVQSTSRLETLLNPNKGSDESFFTSASGAPNIMLIVDTSCSMNAWPESWPTQQGCNHPGFAGAGYDPNTDYRGFVQTINGNPLEDPAWFDDGLVYDVSVRNFGHNFKNSQSMMNPGGPSTATWATRNAACATTTGTAVGNATHTACLACLNTSGYYVYDQDKRIGVGNYLEYYAPRDVSAIMVLSQLVYDVREIRLGIMTFDSWGSNACWVSGMNNNNNTNKTSCTGGGGLQRCYETSNDPNNCGGCGIQCTLSQYCESSVCVAKGSASCPNNMTSTGTSCVNTDDDVNNCGSIGNVCTGSANLKCSGGSCSSGVSGGNCTQHSRTNCSGKCVKTSRDRANCGTCGTVCAANQYCSSGSCTAVPTSSCPSGLDPWTQTDGGVVCVETDNNPERCGSGGTTCAAGQECKRSNSSASCSNLNCNGMTTGGKVCLWQPLGPNCDKMYPLDTSSVENNRSSILNNLAKDNPFSMSTPLATILYAAGFHFRSASTDGFASALATQLGAPYPNSSLKVNALDEPNAANQKAICSACGFNAVIILTDGSPNNELLGTLPTQITSLTTATAATCPAGTGLCDSYLDEIAAFLWQSDIRADMPGKQSVATYTIGFATGTSTNQLLNSTAKVGGGTYYPATGAADIKDALLNIFDDINTRNSSFSSAATVAVQTGSTSAPAVLPRMQPKAGQPWEGHVWRFEQYNEFVESTNTIADLNSDGDNEDIFIVDSATPTIANVVTELPDGTFVRNGTSTPATPFWEANAKLVTDLTGNLNARNIWTVLDTDGDGAFTSADSLVRLYASGSATADVKLAEYMGLVGSPYCPSGTGNGALLARFGMSVAEAESVSGFSLPGSPTEADYARLCALVVVRWVQGYDLFDVDGDSVLAEPRPSVLGDIFHASPILVGPPVEPFLCELGLSNQCARTLYSQNLGISATPLANETGGTACSVTPTKPAYDIYVWDQRKRDKLVLVGSNDGMVHAFMNGSVTGETCTGSQPVPAFDRGTGREAWAFIPPDLLPKLPDLIIKHEYMIDGDIMLRDIWADGSGGGSLDGIKTKNEFHTMAVVAEGRGGKHYFALEVKYQNDNQTVQDRPGFQWMFPQPCSTEAATFGKTLLALSPKAPPIGPVLIDDSTLPSSIPGAVSRYGVNTHERWMVAVSGGWSPGLEKGRGVYLLDAWQGKVNGRRDNLWWKFEFIEGASGTAAPAKELTTSVAAPVALVDYGGDNAPGQDGFFDTAVFGDTSGQLWVSRFFDPGQYSSSGNAYRITNWYTGRAFEMDRDGVPGGATGSTLPDGGTEAADTNAKSVANKAPFYYLPSVAIEPGTDRMRIFAGTGNRYALLEPGAGSCRFDNPLACSKSRCDDNKIVSHYKDKIVDINASETHWKNRRFEHGKQDISVTIQPNVTLTAGNMCGSNGAKQVEAENAEYKVGACDMVTGADVTPGDVNQIKYECGMNATGSSFTCTMQGSMKRNVANLLDDSNVDTTNLGNNRFVGLWAYGGTQSDGGFRGFAGTSGVTPQAYDSARVSDRSTANSSSGELTDVTNVGCVASGRCDGGAPEGGYGWFYTYSTLPTKTATGAAVLASCVLWSDLAPTGGDAGTCGGAGTPLSGIYQADFITGQPNCAYGFLDAGSGLFARGQSRSVVAPPPEPASVVQVSKSGQIRYSAMIVEPGKPQATTVDVSGNQDVLQLVYQLPVSTSLHNCRHADAGCNVSP